MRFEFRHLPVGKERRPLVQFQFGAMPGVRFLGLVDSGSDQSYFDAQVASSVGVDLESCERASLLIAGNQHNLYVSRASLVIGQFAWDAEVRFAENWNHGHSVLGINGLFDFFDVGIDPQRGVVDLAPWRNDTRVTRIRR